MKTARVKTTIRKEEILKAAAGLACVKGYSQVTRDDIGKAVGLVGSAVQYHFKTMPQLRRDLMRYAVAHRILKVIAQGLVAQDPYALKADERLQRAAIETAL